MKKHWQLLFLLFLIVGSVLIIRENKHSFYTNEGKVFGTLYRITYEYNQDLQSEIVAQLQRVDNSLSPFNPQSIISKINRNETVTVDSLFTEVFLLADTIYQRTNGAFDITVAPLVNAWGFGFKNASSITGTVIDSLRQFVGMESIQLENGQVVKADQRTQLDCSAIAKGYGSDVVARLFNQKGIANYMVEIGGEVVVKGHNPKGNYWNIGVNKPIEDSLSVRQDLQTILQLTNCGMATSGNYRNFYYKEGQKYAHTIDPRVGYPVQHSLLSATVIAPNCMTADALATAFMVMGIDSALQYCEQYPHIEAYFILAGDSGQFVSRQTFLDEEISQALR